MGNVSDYNFVVRSTGGACSTVKLAMPAILTNPNFTKTTNPTTGQVTYDFKHLKVGSLIFQATIDIPQTVPIGISNLVLQPLGTGTINGGAYYLHPNYTVVNNMLQLPASKYHRTVFTRNDNSVNVGTLFDTQRWILSSRSNGRLFAPGQSYQVFSHEAFDGYDGPEYCAYPGIRVNNTTGAPISFTFAAATLTRERAITVQCYYEGDM